MSALIALALLAGQAPAAERAEALAEAVLEGARYGRGTAGAIADAPWWPGFGDPGLDALMGTALGDNADLAAAWARVDQARARRLQAGSALLPQLSADLSISASPDDALGFGFIPSGLTDGSTPTVYNDYSAYFIGSAYLRASWNLDIWGRAALGTRAGALDALATEGDTQAQRIAVAEAVAGAWYDVVAGRQRLALVSEQLRLSEELLELLELRFEGGEATALDVLQQRQQLAGARLQLPAARAGLEGAIQRLAALTGQTPQALLEGLPDTAALPELPPPPATGTPADLLESRPDLRAASAAARAARDRRLSAALGYLPSLGLSAQVGYQGLDDTSTDTTEGWDTIDSWTVGATLSLPLFTGGRTTAALSEARAGELAALETLRSAILGAVQQVEGALSQDAALGEQRAAWEAQAEAARQSFEESRSRYIEGLTSYLTVLNALNVAQAAELNALQAHRDQLTARIALHSALGGGWATADRGEFQP